MKIWSYTVCDDFMTNSIELLMALLNMNFSTGDVFIVYSIIQVELVSGYGITLTQRQLDAAMTTAGGSATKLMRSLIGCFFEPDVLAASTAYGIRGKKALDQDILSACIREYLYACSVKFNFLLI